MVGLEGASALARSALTPQHDEPAALAVYETIDLGLVGELDAQAPALDESLARLSLASPSQRALEYNVPLLARDPIHATRVYVRHALGAHALNLEPWLPALAMALSGVAESADGDEAGEREIERALHRGGPTDVRWLVKLSELDAGSVRPRAAATAALEVLDDVYLGYGLLLVTADLDSVVAIELRLPAGAAPSTRSVAPPSHLPAADAEADSTLEPNESVAFPSALSVKPFVVPKLLQGGLPIRPKVSTPGRRRTDESATQADDIAVLREAAEATTQLRGGIRDLATAGNVVQDRIALQIAELQRQLGRLGTIRDQAGRATAGGATERRCQAAAAQQRQLLDRMDRLLQRLMNRHQRAVTPFERRWFDELGRISSELSIERDDAGRSLASRTARVR